MIQLPDSLSAWNTADFKPALKRELEGLGPAGLPLQQGWLHSSDIRFGCHCSALRVMTALSLLDRSEIQELVDEGEALSIGCDYCGASYQVEVAQLQGLLSAS